MRSERKFKKADAHSQYKVYTVTDSNGKEIAKCDDAKKCAELMGISIPTFYTYLKRPNKKYSITSDYKYPASDEKQRVLSYSYGKDSGASIRACQLLDWKIDKIVCVDIWATDKLRGELPEKLAFQSKADEIIKKEFGLTVEHIRGEYTAEELFYKQCGDNSKRCGQIHGFPMIKHCWFKYYLTQRPMEKALDNAIVYVGIAADETDRIPQLTETFKSPLVALDWEEDLCGLQCKYMGLLSPIYDTACRDGCWFCPNQSLGQLRNLRNNHPELWEVLLRWDADSPTHFKADGRTVHDLEERFAEEKNQLSLYD